MNSKPTKADLIAKLEETIRLLAREGVYVYVGDDIVVGVDAETLPADAEGPESTFVTLRTTE